MSSWRALSTLESRESESDPFTLSRQLRVEGRVHSFDGRAVTAAVVSLGAATTQRQATTSEDGTYALSFMLQDLTQDADECTIEVRHSSFQAARAQVNLLSLRERSTSRVEGVDFLLEPLGTQTRVTGTVHDEEREALVGIVVKLTSPAMRRTLYEVTTDPAGRFEIPDAVAGNYRLVVTPPGFKSYVRESLTVSEDGIDLDIVVERLAEAWLSGTMVNPEGAPVGGLNLLVSSRDSGNTFAKIIGDASGSFEAQPVPAGELVLVSSSQTLHRIQGLRLGAGELRPDVRLVIDHGDSSLSGIVVDEQDVPVPKGSVKLLWNRSEENVTSTSLRHTLTDAEGRFDFAGIAPVEHVLTIKAEGYSEVRWEIDPSEEQLFLRLQESGV